MAAPEKPCEQHSNEGTSDSFETLVSDFGFLTDLQIRRAIQHGHLLEQGTWIDEQIRHASYTLRLGDEVHIARAITTVGAETKEFSVVRMSKVGDGVELRPGDTALLYSMERIRLPDCVLAFTVARGLLFAEALAPENTYADPGFAGSLYITVTNVSSRIVQLTYGMSVARIFFYRLASSVQHPYRSGSSLGIDQQLSSVRAVSVTDARECETAFDSDLLSSIRAIPLGGAHLAEIIERLTTRLDTARRQLFAVAIAWPILLLVANNSKWMKDNLGTFLGNVAASIVAAIILLVAARFPRTR